MRKVVNTRLEFINEVKNYLPKNPVCMEIGAYQGEFSRVIYDVLKPSKLYLIDAFEELKEPLTKQDYYDNLDFKHRIIYSNEGSLKILNNLLSEGIEKGDVVVDVNLSTDAVKNYRNGFFDFIYIDCCHLYECVKFDMENYFPKLKRGGYLAGHDYGDFGVTRAVDEFCEKYGYEIMMTCSYQGDWILTSKV